MDHLSIMIAQFPYLGIFILLILGGIGFPFPEDTTLILSGFLVSHQLIQPLPAFFVIYPGLLISDFFLYWVGKKYGRKIVEHRKFQKIITLEKLLKIEEKFNRKGILVVLFGRHLLGLRTQIFLVAGVMRMKSIKFVLTDAATSLVTIILMGGIGYVGGNGIQALMRHVAQIEHIIIVVLAIFLAIGIIFWYLKKGKNWNN